MNPAARTHPQVAPGLAALPVAAVWPQSGTQRVDAPASAAPAASAPTERVVVVDHRASLPARVEGLELGGHLFFVDLPGARRGLGLQASYTYIESETTNIALGTRMPLQGLPRNALRRRVNPQLTLALDGGNLTRTVRCSYFGSQTRPDAAPLNDRQYSASASLAF